MNITAHSCFGVPAGVTVFMTTAGDGATFNKYGADGGKVKESYDQLKKQFEIEDLVTLHQCHSADIVKVNRANFSALDGASGDGLFTADCNLALGVLTADCYPVMLAGKNHVAALHCGWRGTVKGIIAGAIKLFNAQGEQPEYAYIGAGISKDAFRVQNDFITDIKKYIDPEPYLSVKDDKYYFDLAQLIKDQLQYHGVGTVEHSGVCTSQDRRFHSYRRDGKDAGRMLTVIYRKGCSDEHV